MVKGRRCVSAQSRPASFVEGWASTVPMRFSVVNAYLDHGLHGWRRIADENFILVLVICVLGSQASVTNADPIASMTDLLVQSRRSSFIGRQSRDGLTPPTQDVVN
jgi:hypothetical protein